MEGSLLSRERIVHAANAAVLVGSLALSAAGCTSPEATPAKTVATYEAPAGADALPLVSDHNASPVSRGRYIDRGQLAYNIKEEVFVSLENPHPNSEPKENRTYFPGDKSAPVMDIVIGTDGQLRYKTFNDRLGGPGRKHARRSGGN